MSSFKTLNTKKYQKSGPLLTPDYVYWKKLGVPTLIKEFGAIDYIDFSPVEPYYFAVTCSVRVQIYNPITKLVVKNLSRFQESAYGGSFRHDGKLLVAGDEAGFVKLFDVSSKNVLRLFRGHAGPVHRTFFTSDLLHIASFSDDKTVRLWDIAGEKSIQTYSSHNDYIRAGCINPVSENIILSGGYDNTIKMYDTRCEQVTMNIVHGSPVETLLFLPTGGIFLSGGGTEIKVWDAFAGGKLLAKLSQHHKTVTTLRLANNGKRILSSGLDRHVKIYDVATYQNVHTLDYPNAILSLDISPNDQTVVAGMIDGLISIQNMENDQNEQLNKDADKKRYSSMLTDFDNVVEDYNKKAESKHDHWLRKYEYSKALDCVLKPYVVNKLPHVTVSVMQELIRRKGLHRALAGRSHNSLASIIRFIMRYIGEHRFMRVLIDVSNILIDIYEDTFHNFTGELGKLFIDLSKTLRKEVDLTYDLLELQGIIELITSAASITDDNDESVQYIKDKSSIQQSLKAKESSIVVIN